MVCKYIHHSCLLLFVVVLSGYLLDQDALAMEPNLIPEPPIENPPDRRDAPPLPLTPIVKSNKRFFRPAPRSFVQADRGVDGAAFRIFPGTCQLYDTSIEGR